jgi:hypothetical protein
MTSVLGVEMEDKDWFNMYVKSSRSSVPTVGERLELNGGRAASTSITGLLTACTIVKEEVPVACGLAAAGAGIGGGRFFVCVAADPDPSSSRSMGLAES